MVDATKCAMCGTLLSPEVAAGLCPKCLLQAGLASGAGSVTGSFDAGSGAGSRGPSFTPPTVEELAPRFPQLELIELLGQGGMGAVYKARQPALDRIVAVKILPPEAGSDPAFADRFAREARALARLAHPHIVSVYEFGQADGQFYLTMEYVDGVNLRQAIRAGDIPPKTALEIVTQVCEALQYAHDEGVVHRDIKPENILVDRRGRVKIADFGLAKLLGADGADDGLTGSHQVMGTMRYMAPEQLEGASHVDHRADIYSLGVVFYELLTGEVPMGRFRPPSEKVAVDVRVDEVVLKSLEREPERRYQHASDVKSDIQQCESPPLASKAAAVSAAANLDPGRRRRRRLIVLSLIFGGIVMATLWKTLLAGLFTVAATTAPPSAIAKEKGVKLSEEDRIAKAEELSQQGWQLWQEGKPSDAIPKFEEAVDLDPDAANSWNGLGWARLNSGQGDKAIVAFEKAVRLEPDHPAPLNGLGQAYLGAGDLKKAEKYLKKAAPQAPAAAFGLGRLYLLTGKYAAAETWLTKAGGDSPNNPTLAMMIDAAKTKELPAGLRRQLEPPKAGHGESSADTSLGWQRFNEGKMRSAELSFRKALSKDPEDAAALNGMGFCLLNSGKAASAKEYFQKCLELDPEASGAMNGLARCQMAEGKTDEAIATWETMREKFPGPSAATTGLATTYLEQKKYAKALPLFEELLAAAPQSAEFKAGLEAAKKGAQEK